MSALSDAEMAQAVADATRAKRRHEPALRALGASGIIGVGLDPAKPTWRQWWARCLVTRTDSMPTPLLAEGYKTAADAMEALVGLAEKDRVTFRRPPGL